MTRLDFLKCIPFLGGVIVPIVSVPKSVIFELVKNPPKVDETIYFIENGISYELRLCDPDVIRYADGTFDINYYKEMFIVVGRATTTDLSPNNFRKLVAEGNYFPKNKLKENLEKEVDFVFQKLVKNWHKAQKHYEVTRRV